MNEVAVKSVKTEHRLLNLIQEHHPGFHPALILADIAANSDDVVVKLNAAKSLMPYVAPALKSMEVHGEVKHDHGQLHVSIKKEEDDNGVIDVTPKNSYSEETDILDEIFGATE